MTRIDGIPKRRFLLRLCAARELAIYRAFHFTYFVSPLTLNSLLRLALCPYLGLFTCMSPAPDTIRPELLSLFEETRDIHTIVEIRVWG